MWRLWRILWMWRISIFSVTQMKLFLFHTNFNFYKNDTLNSCTSAKVACVSMVVNTLW